MFFRKKRILVGLLAAACAFTCLLSACGEETVKQDGQQNEERGEETVKRELRILPEGFKYDITKEEHIVEYDGISLYGEIYEPLESGKFPAVIFSHGYNGHYTDFPTECKRFAERGYVCYAFDFCGAQANGKSRGRTAAEYTPFTMKEDLRAVIGHIKKLPNVDETQVFLLGGSQGGFVSALTTADEDIKKEIAALALYFPALNIPDDWSAKYPTEASLPAENAVIDFWGHKINGSFIRSVYHYDPYAVIGNYGKDVCIVWGNNDEIVKKPYIDRAVEVYGDRAELTVIEGAGHGFGGAALTRATNTVLTFLEARTFEC